MNFELMYTIKKRKERVCQHGQKWGSNELIFCIFVSFIEEVAGFGQKDNRLRNKEEEFQDSE